MGNTRAKNLFSIDKLEIEALKSVEYCETLENNNPALCQDC